VWKEVVEDLRSLHLNWEDTTVHSRWRRSVNSNKADGSWE